MHCFIYPQAQIRDTSSVADDVVRPAGMRHPPTVGTLVYDDLNAEAANNIGVSSSFGTASLDWPLIRIAADG